MLTQALLALALASLLLSTWAVLAGLAVHKAWHTWESRKARIAIFLACVAYATALAVMGEHYVALLRESAPVAQCAERAVGEKPLCWMTNAQKVGKTKF